MNPSDSDFRARQRSRSAGKNQQQEASEIHKPEYVDPWLEYAVEVIKSRNFSGADDWYRKILAKTIVDHINSAYVAALAAADGPPVLDVRTAQGIMGRHPSHAARQARQSQSKGYDSWHFQATMDPYFPLAVTASLDIREFAPPLLEVQHSTLLEALRVAEDSLNGANSSKTPPSMGDFQVATYFVTTSVGAEIVDALRAGQAKLVVEAIRSLYDRDSAAFRRFPSSHQSVKQCAHVLIRWGLSVALIARSDFAELIREWEVQGGAEHA